VEPTVVDVEVVERGRQAWQMRACGALVTAVFLAGIVGLTIVSPGRSWTPAQQLARVRQFVQDARTAHFTGTSTWQAGTISGQVGHRIEHSTRAEGVLALPNGSHWTEDMGDSATETIVLPDAMFVRDADSTASLAGEQWKQYPREQRKSAAPSPVGSGSPEPGVISEVGGVFSAFGAPLEFSGMFDRIKDLRRVSPQVIVGTLDVASLPDFPDGEPVPTVTVEVESDTVGRLLRILTTATGTMTAEAPDTANSGDEKFMARSETRFTHWGVPVDVSAPSAGNVDKTPDVDEEGLAAFSAAPILVPGALPTAYQLTDGSVSEPGDAGDCPEADLTYGDPSQSPADPAAVSSDINVTITPANCDQSAIDGGDPITVAGHPGHIARAKNSDEEPSVTVEIVIGATRMSVDSDLPEAELIAALRTIVPFDLAKQRIATAQSPT